MHDTALEFTSSVIPGSYNGDCDGRKNAAGCNDRVRVPCAGLGVRVCSVEDNDGCEYEDVGVANLLFVRVDIIGDRPDTSYDLRIEVTMQIVI